MTLETTRICDFIEDTDPRRRFQGDPVELKWNRKDLGSLRVVLDKYVRGRNVAVQAGACLGVFPSHLASEFRTVYTFEPDPALFVQMTANAPQRNIVRFQAALGNYSRLVTTVCALRPNDGKTTLHPGMTRTDEVLEGGFIPTVRIDDLGLGACDLIYLDVEGDEMYAVQGARETIKNFRPTVVLEINRGLAYRGFSRDDAMTHMRMLDYECVDHLRSDAVFVPRERA